jgi:hypothetical protein
MPCLSFFSGSARPPHLRGFHLPRYRRALGRHGRTHLPLGRTGQRGTRFLDEQMGVALRFKAVEHVERYQGSRSLRPQLLGSASQFNQSILTNK